MSLLAILVAVVVALAGCKSRSTDDSEVMAKMRQFADAMCACKDKACTDDVQYDMTTWATEAAKREGSRDEDRPSETTMKEMTEIGQKYADCMTKVMKPDVPEPPSGAPPRPRTPPQAPPTATVDRLIAAARTFAPTEHPQLVIASIHAVYVDANGKLDEDDGRLTIILGTAAAPVDDPRRRIGAPVKPRPTAPSKCRELVWSRARGWVSNPYHCIEVRPPFPLCAVTDIWTHAIAKDAPRDAVAIMQLREDVPRRWEFTIVDEPRKINIQLYLPDDCPLAVEAP